jgi:hypothetical protein
MEEQKKDQGRQILPTESALGGLTGSSQGRFDQKNKSSTKDTHKKRIGLGLEIYEHFRAVTVPVPKLS